MQFRYFDAGGRQLTPEQLRSMEVQTQVMDHVFATVTERMGKNVNFESRIENDRSE